MAEIVVKVDVPLEFKKEFEVALTRVVDQFIRDSTLLALKERLESKEESELENWSVELGRNAKEDSFRKLLSKFTPEKREELLKFMSPEKRKKYQ